MFETPTMRSLDRTPITTAAARLGISVPDAMALVERGALQGTTHWVFTESLLAFTSAKQ
jgi:hypothetical protein